MEIGEPCLRLGTKNQIPVLPPEGHNGCVQRVMRENQSLALLCRQTIFDQCEICVLVAAVDLVAHNRMTEVRKVNAELVFATRARRDSQQGEWFS